MLKVNLGCYLGLREDSRFKDCQGTTSIALSSLAHVKPYGDGMSILGFFTKKGSPQIKGLSLIK